MPQQPAGLHFELLKSIVGYRTWHPTLLRVRWIWMPPAPHLLVEAGLVMVLEIHGALTEETSQLRIRG